MNERILELAEQAGMRFDRFGMVIPTTLAVQETVNLEKFAELIVRETMQVVANQLPSNQYLDVAHAVIEHYKDNDAI